MLSASDHDAVSPIGEAPHATAFVGRARWLPHAKRRMMGLNQG